MDYVDYYSFTDPGRMEGWVGILVLLWNVRKQWIRATADRRKENNWHFSTPVVNLEIIKRRRNAVYQHRRHLSQTRFIRKKETLKKALKPMGVSAPTPTSPPLWICYCQSNEHIVKVSALKVEYLKTVNESTFAYSSCKSCSRCSVAFVSCWIFFFF